MPIMSIAKHLLRFSSPSLGVGRTCQWPRAQCRYLASNTSQEEPATDPERLFLEPDVQRLLYSIIGYEPDLVFKPKPVPAHTSSKYLFMTEEELKMAQDAAYQRGRKMLQMVPFMTELKDQPQILDDTPELQGFETSNIVFTDISIGASNRNRLIVVREPNGILRRADQKERHRMNQTFFPMAEKNMFLPKMFQEENLEKVLERGDFYFILERAAVQFEPDDPVYINTVSRTYDRIRETGEFDKLRGTRHFGSMIFYYCVNNNLDQVLCHLIKNSRLGEAHLLVQLYYTINKSKAAGFAEVGNDAWQAIKYFTKESSQKRHILELAIASIEEEERKRNEVRPQAAESLA